MDKNYLLYGKKYPFLLEQEVSKPTGFRTNQSCGPCDTIYERDKQFKQNNARYFKETAKLTSGIAGRITAIGEPRVLKEHVLSIITAMINRLDLAYDFNLKAAFLLEYHDMHKIVVCIPIKNQQTGVDEFLAFRLDIENSEPYFIQWLSSNKENMFQSGELSFYHLNPSLRTRDINEMNRIGFIIIDEDGQPNYRLTWTPHGGFPSWGACFKNYYGEPWVIIGSIVSPVGMAIGVGLGCL